MDTNLNRLALSFYRESFSVFLGQSKLKLVKPYPSHSFIFCDAALSAHLSRIHGVLNLSCTAQKSSLKFWIRASANAKMQIWAPLASVWTICPWILLLYNINTLVRAERYECGRCWVQGKLRGRPCFKNILTVKSIEKNFGECITLETR